MARAANVVAVSTRHVRRVFPERVGVSPAGYARLAQVALEAGTSTSRTSAATFASAPG